TEMSTHYDEETVKEVLEIAQKVTGCHLSTFPACDIYAREEVLADIIPLTALTPPLYEGNPYGLNYSEHGADTLFPCIHKHLGLQPHHTIRFIHRYHSTPTADHPGEWYWKLLVSCQEEPFPALGWDWSRETEGIWQRWFEMMCISCHGI